MAKWKKVYVPGKGDRWTDGNGNYRYTNPALKDNVKGAARSLKSSLSDIASGYQKAGERTANRLASEEKAKVQRGFGSRQRSERTQAEAAEMAKPKPKPKPQPKPVPKAEAKPKPKPIPKEETKASQPSKPQPKPVPKAESKPQPKPIPKADSKPKEKAYGESGKDLYMASKKNNPLMQRTFGYQTGEAPDQKKAAESKAQPPASKRGSTSPASGVTYSPEEKTKGNTGFNQESVNKLMRNRETEEQKRKRKAAEASRNIG